MEGGDGGCRKSCVKGLFWKEGIVGENGLLKQLTKAIVERTLQVELTPHLRYGKHSREGNAEGNARNAASSKRLKGKFGTVEIEVPRERQASFEPKLVPKGATRFAGFDDKILSLYARGMEGVNNFV
jgi:putative transposase